MRAGPRQLALALAHSRKLRARGFSAGRPNAAALALIDRWPDWPGRVMALVGPHGSGKSHLAAIWAEEAGARFLSMRERRYRAASRDARDRCAGGRGFFGTVVRRGGAVPPSQSCAAGGRISAAHRAHASPPASRIALPDLASRLRAIPAVTLSAPDDALLRAVIVKLFADRQLGVDENLVAYLVARIERSFPAARAAVDRLDREAMRQKRSGQSRARGGALSRGHVR